MTKQTVFVVMKGTPESYSMATIFGTESAAERYVAKQLPILRSIPGFEKYTMWIGVWTVDEWSAE